MSRLRSRSLGSGCKVELVCNKLETQWISVSSLPVTDSFPTQFETLVMNAVSPTRDTVQVLTISHRAIIFQLVWIVIFNRWKFSFNIFFSLCGGIETTATFIHCIHAAWNIGHHINIPWTVRWLFCFRILETDRTEHYTFPSANRRIKFMQIQNWP